MNFGEHKIERIGDDVFVRNVAIFDAHEDDSRPDPLKVVDRRKLETILSRASERLETEGELPVAVEVHTPKKGESHAPPPVKGGYVPKHIGRIGKGARERDALFSDLRFSASDWPSLQGYQRRSLELFADTLEPDTLVLLGSKAPARDLGRLTPLVAYSRDGRQIVRYEMPTETTDSTPVPQQEHDDMPSLEEIGALMDEKLAAFQATLPDVFQGVLDKALADENQDGVPDAEEGLGDDLNADGVPDVLEPQGEPAENGMAVQGEMPEKKEKDMYENLREEDAKVRYERVQKQIKAQDEEIKQLRRERDTEHYTRRLTTLLQRGFELDRAKELDRIMKMGSKADRDAHLSVIEENYRCDPTSYTPIAQDAERYERTGALPSTNWRTDRDLSYKVNAFQKANGLASADEAYKQMISNGAAH